MDMPSSWCVAIKCVYVYANLLIFAHLLALYDFDLAGFVILILAWTCQVMWWYFVFFFVADL